MTTYGAASDEGVVGVTTFPFQWAPACSISFWLLSTHCVIIIIFLYVIIILFYVIYIGQ